MSPPVHEHSRADDAIRINLGSDSVKKILGALLALLATGGVAKGIYIAIEKHDHEIRILQENDVRQENKLDQIGEHLMKRNWKR